MKTRGTAIFFMLITMAGVAQQSTPSNATGADMDRGVIRLRSDEGLFTPNAKKVLSYRDEDLVITLVNGKNKLALDVASRSQPVERIELPPEIVQVNEIRAAQNGKAIIVGMVNGSVFQVVLLNTIRLGVADTFLAYSPSVSPNGRFIAFVKFYPAHFVDGTDDHYLLYDTLRNAAENRPTNGSPTDRTNVGLSIYPHAPNIDGDNTDVPEQKQHHMIAQRFFWQSDSSRYAFADTHAGEWSAVIVSVLKGVPDARSTPMNKKEICAPLQKDTCQVTLVDAELTPSGILLNFQGVSVDSAPNSEDIRITDMYDMSVPGEYSVQVDRTFSGVGHFTPNFAKIDVTPC